MFKNKSYIGISFIILIFGIYAVPKIVDRIKNDDVVKGNRLDNVGLKTSKSDAKLMKIGPAPKFELTNQDNLKVSNETYKGKVYVLEFFFTTCPSICPKMNLSMLEIEKTFSAILILASFQSQLIQLMIRQRFLKIMQSY